MPTNQPDLRKIPATPESPDEHRAIVSSFDKPTGSSLSDNNISVSPLINPGDSEVLRKWSQLVSVIVPTKNSRQFLEACLNSIKNQNYKNIEIIVVDNFSNDETVQIAKKYTNKFFQAGPERSSQVNFGVEKANGAYVYKVDSDFILDKQVIEQCIEKVNQGFDAIVVHNTPDESVSWIAKIRKFEVDMYKYDLLHSSARFVKKSVYKDIGGFNPSITAGEDYDFQNKLNRSGYKTGFIEAEALHRGEPKKFWAHMKKYYFYGKDFANYQQHNPSESKSQLMNIFRNVYIKNWLKFVKHPIKALAFVIYNSIKYLFGGLGLMSAKISKLNWTIMRKS